MCLNFLMMDFDHVRYSKNKLFIKEKKNLTQAQELEVSIHIIFYLPL